MQITSERRRWTRVDRVMLALVRLVHDEQWSDVEAAAELHRQGHQRSALTAARARVAAVDRSSRYGDRALATLDAALEPAPAGSVFSHD